MNTFPFRWPALVLLFGLVAALSPGCAVTGGGYGDSVSFGLDYFEPYGGNDYGGWGPGYQVAPFRGGDHRSVFGGGRSMPHAYRSAAATRSMPSIPSRSRSGGARSR